MSLLRWINPKNTNTDIKIFTSLAYDKAKYTSGVLNQFGTNVKISGNYVENAPEWIIKSGFEFRYKTLFTNIQYSYASESFNDAFNAGFSANGVTGLIPAYHVWDWGLNWQFLRQYHLSASINNLTNEKYFNRRITMYPGPGILPADGRTFTVSMGMSF